MSSNGIDIEKEHNVEAGIHPTKDDSKDSEDKDTYTPNTSTLLYRIEDKPAWYLCIFLGFQHFLTLVGGTISGPFILAGHLCMLPEDPARGELLSTIFFINGIITILQSSIGVRLPIIQSGTFSFVIPIITILELPQWKCPDNLATLSDDEKTEVWQVRVREIQGAVIIASFSAVFLGLTGIVGILLRFLTPLTVAPVIATIGLTLFPVVGDMMALHWPIALGTVVLLTIFSQHLEGFGFPCLSFLKGRGWRFTRFYAFRLFPVLFVVVCMWSLCTVLTLTNLLSEDSPARSDAKIKLVYEASWFRVPYPGQWGMPTVSLNSVIGILAGVVVLITESIGDYYACARLSFAPPPPTHAVNRGITIEGIGCVLAGMWGAINGTTSYSENVGAIGITKVGSRRVILCAGIIMVLTGMFSKACALFVSIPEPIVGGMFCVMFALITAVGVSNLQHINFNSTRNLFVFGLALFLSLVIPQWLNSHPNAINTGSVKLDQITTVLLSTSMFVAGSVGCLLDNTIPGSDRDRGLHKWNQKSGTDDKENEALKCYDLPFGMEYLKRNRSWTSWIPISPTYTGWRFPKCLRRKERSFDIKVNTKNDETCM